MPFAAAVSRHPVSAHATGEVIGRVVEDVGTHPDLVILLVTSGHVGALEDVTRTVRTLLTPAVMIGATTPAVVGAGVGYEGGPGMALWAGMTGPVRPLRLPAADTAGPGRRATQWWSGPGSGSFRPSGAVVIGDQATCGPRLLGGLERDRAGVPVTGGLTAGGPLILDDRAVQGGLVGAVLGAGVRFDAVVGRGWRAIGPSLVVTEADVDLGLLRELDGVPALDRLHRLASDEVPATEVAHINRGLAVGAEVADAGRSASPVRTGRSASLIHEVLGADRSNGAIATTGAIPPGTAVRFWVREDPAVDLRRVLRGREADSALAFVAGPAGREGDGGGDRGGGERGGQGAEVVAEALDTPVVTGMVVPAQIGPLGAQLATLRADASVALLTDR